MINKNSVEAVKKAAFEHDFCRPLYKSYCFSQIPATIQRLLGGKSGGLPLDCTGDGVYDKVILLFIDGFGWRFFDAYKERYPFLQRFINDGIASKITSQFPSTTAGHVTCLNTGLEVAESGVYEWFYYEPKLDRMIAPLLFSFAGDKEVGTLAKAGVIPSDIYPRATFYEELNAPAFVFQHASIAKSPYTRTVFHGASQYAYTQFPQAVQELSSLVEKTKRGYFYLYFGEFDAQAHRHGVSSKEAEGALDGCFYALETYLKKSPKTATIVIADHGMTEIDPKTTWYLNQEIPGFEKYIQKSHDGRLLNPAGSCRDYFLHVQEQKIPEVEALLAHHLKDRAAVYRTKEMIKEGLFGSKEPSTAFLARVGNLAILAHEHNSIWWYEKGRFEQRFHAMHGGLTRNEMETIFLFIPA